MTDAEMEAVRPVTSATHLTTRELAARWRVSPRTLERWRVEGRGPRWIALPRRAIYPIADVLAFERAHRRGG